MYGQDFKPFVHARDGASELVDESSLGRIIGSKQILYT